MAAKDTLESEPGALEGAVFLERLKGVFGTCRDKAAARRSERRDAGPVEQNQKDEGKTGYPSKYVPGLSHVILPGRDAPGLFPYGRKGLLRRGRPLNCTRPLCPYPCPEGERTSEGGTPRGYVF